MTRRLACLLLLAACARPVLPTPAGPEILAIHEWHAVGQPRAIILALHGFGDAGELAFDDAAAYWASRGITTYAPDQRGFGDSPSRKVWPGGDVLVADAVALSQAVHHRHPGVPLVVVGESMGGGIALAAAAEGLDADALVLSAPAIAGGNALSPFARTSARTLAAVMPDKRWTGGDLVEIWPTDNYEALVRAAFDPRSYADASSREIWGLVALMDRAAAAAPSVVLPTLTLMGDHDELLRSENVHLIHARIPGAIGFIEYPDGWHWLFRDRQAAIVWRDVADFALSPSAAKTGLPLPSR